MAQNNYFEKVVADIAAAQYDKSNAMMRKIKLAYSSSLDTLNLQLLDLYEKMLRDGVVSPLTLYKMDRYITLFNKIKQETESLGIAEKTVMFDGFKNMYTNTFQKTNEAIGLTYSYLPQPQIDKVLAVKWQGRNFSDSIWSNKELLFEKLDKQIIQTISLGQSKDEAVKVIKDVMNTGFANADRLVRTEALFFINQAQKDSYIQAGYTQYRFMAAKDERTCKDCMSRDGKIYNFAEAIVGVNFPPTHPNSRSTIVPILESKN